ncbi:hypothetical protein LCGC14_1977390, partial [marine sediment metagenome]
DLLYLAKYVLRDSDQSVVSDIVNITLNWPAVFGANVVSSLGNAREQIIVEAEDKNVDTNFVEEFVNAAMGSANRRMRRRGLHTLNQWADTQFCFRGRHARRVLLSQEKETGDAVVNITPWDGRYVYHEQGEDGLKWAAYETIRSWDEIIAEYGEEFAGKASDKECAVLDVWDDKVNEIWIDGAMVGETRPHNYGFCPVVLQVVYLGYGRMLLDRNWQLHDGESIFFMVRDIVPEVNRLVSILQTLNMNELKVALQFLNPDGTDQDEPPDRPGMGDVISMGKGKLEAIHLGEARQAAQQLYAILEKARQEGSYTDIDIGNVRQPFSAVALVAIGENKDMVYMPRLAAKEQLNIDTAEMLIRQALQIGGFIDLGTPGHKKAFATSKLMGEYDIQYKYFTKSPKIDIARMSLADAAAPWYPRRFIYENVLQVEDPDGLEEQWYSEQAELLSPNVRMVRTIRKLLRRAKEKNDPDAAREAQIMANDLGISIDQARAGELEPPEIEAPKPGQSALPLLGEGGQVGGVNPGRAPEGV